MVLRRQVGQELERAGRVGDHDSAFRVRRAASSFPGSRCAARGSRSIDVPARRSGLEVTTALPLAATWVSTDSLPLGCEVEIDVVGGHGGLRGVRGGDQAGVAVAVDLLCQAVVVEIHGEFVGRVAQLARGKLVDAVGVDAR